MKKPSFLSMEDFNYPLPEEKIAKYPLERRDESKLLMYREGSIVQTAFKDLQKFIPASSHLVFNETRVIHARLIFKKATGSAIEIFCLEPIEPVDYQMNFAHTKNVKWKCLVGNLKKWKGEILELDNGKGLKLRAEWKSKKENAQEIEFSWTGKDISFSEVIEIFGKTPIPPYLNRPAVESDSENYQTVFSRNEGSVAAPTAGLHFTEELLSDLKNRKHTISFLNLHVGAGTFVPVKKENAAEHNMHIERVVISKSCILSLKNNHDLIIPVGTTSCRSLESLYWIGSKIINQTYDPDTAILQQWEAYDLPGEYSRMEILSAVDQFLDQSGLEKIEFSTGIMITPGYEFKMTDGLITNFHQPSSTLLMLVAALIGDSWKRLYRFALDNDFRFLSYGDSSLLFRE